jgi:hypothetical protein
MREKSVKKSRIFKVLSYGINSYDNTRGVGTMHAEANAILNLQKIYRNKKHLSKINILVIRISPTGKLGNSKPCIKCIIDMINIPQKKGYIIKNILYSNENGLIESTTLDRIIGEKNFHISRFYRMTNFNHPLLSL